jgi:hypothetical protein
MIDRITLVTDEKSGDWFDDEQCGLTLVAMHQLSSLSLKNEASATTAMTTTAGPGDDGKPSTASHRRRAIDGEPSTASHRRRAINGEPSTASHQRRAINGEPSTATVVYGAD